MRQEDFEAICHRGTLAWRQLKKDKNWSHWVQVGEALIAGREWAMRQAGTNQPVGKGYNLVFGEWLKRYKLDDIDKGDRSRLLKCMENLPAIEDWRRGLEPGERLRLNHPNAVWRNWQAFMRPEPRAATGEPKPTLRDSVVNLSEELERARAHIAELEAARGAARRQRCRHCGQPLDDESGDDTAGNDTAGNDAARGCMAQKGYVLVRRDQAEDVRAAYAAGAQRGAPNR